MCDMASLSYYEAAVPGTKRINKMKKKETKRLRKNVKNDILMNNGRKADLCLFFDKSENSVHLLT